jgi:hypothetical protein
MRAIIHTVKARRRPIVTGHEELIKRRRRADDLKRKDGRAFTANDGGKSPVRSSAVSACA